MYCYVSIIKYVLNPQMIIDTISIMQNRDTISICKGALIPTSTPAAV